MKDIHKKSIVHRLIHFFGQMGEFIKAYAKNCKDSYNSMLSI
ncbi:hypothetical protein [Sediminicola sp. 1XM1-17]